MKSQPDRVLVVGVQWQLNWFPPIGMLRIRSECAPECVAIKDHRGPREINYVAYRNSRGAERVRAILLLLRHAGWNFYVNAAFDLETSVTQHVACMNNTITASTLIAHVRLVIYNPRFSLDCPAIYHRCYVKRTLSRQVYMC